MIQHSQDLQAFTSDLRLLTPDGFQPDPLLLLAILLEWREFSPISAAGESGLITVIRQVGGPWTQLKQSSSKLQPIRLSFI